MIFAERICIVSSALLFVAIASVVPAMANLCNPAYVNRNAAVITVLPTNSDDSINLRCAIDYAATLGPGVTVQLVEGTYKTAQLVVQGFRGTIRGVGRQKTTLRNSDNAMLVQNPVAWPDSPPSYTNGYPTLISIIGTDVALSDLSIKIVGQHPTTAWYFGGTGPWQFVVPALAFVGSNGVLRTERIEIVGSAKCSPDPETNLLVAIEFWNFATQKQPWPSSSTLVVSDSFFSGCGGVFVADLVSANILVEGNRFDTLTYGVAASDLWSSNVEVSGNDINTVLDRQAGIHVIPGNFATGIRDSSLVFRNNRFSGLLGVRLRPNTFHGAIACAIVGNNVEQVGTVGYWLGAGTYGCTLVGHGKGTVLDETGGAHTIVGVTPHTGGVGHGISEMMGVGNPFVQY